MKKVLILLITSFSFITTSAQTLVDSSLFKAFSSNGMRDTEKKFEQFELKADNNIIYNTDSLLGKITFISFWMENCLPCLAEFKALEKLFQKYKSKSKFQFLSFTRDPIDSIVKIKAQYGFSYPAMRVEQLEIYKYNFKMGFPTIMITDINGNVRYLKSGGFVDEEKVEKTVSSLYYQEIDRLLEMYFPN